MLARQSLQKDHIDEVILGYPIGASGCRILVSLIHEMNKRQATKGLAMLCIGGGMGISMLLSKTP